jgi:hypothetical protein
MARWVRPSACPRSLEWMNPSSVRPPDGDVPESLRVPACVDDAKPVDLEHDRQRGKPLDDLAVQRAALADRVEKGGVLSPTVLVFSAQPVVPGDGVVLVVPHGACRVPGLEHAADDPDGLELPRSPVDEVADEHGLAPLGVPSSATSLDVPEPVEEAFEVQSRSVDVTDDVDPRCDVSAAHASSAMHQSA